MADEPSTPPEPKKLEPRDARKALQNAEERYQNFVTKRTEFNTQAAALREERDELNSRKKEQFDVLRQLKEERQKLIAQLMEHRERRNVLQQRARQLISHKQERAKGLSRKGELTATELRKKAKDLDLHQQTTNLSLEDERSLLERLKRLHGELKVLELEEASQTELVKEINSLNSSIDELFKNADSEHQQVVDYSNKLDVLRAKEKETYFGISHIGSEADKKHKEFLETRKKADHNHERAMELRGTMQSIRKTQRSERMEQRQTIRVHNTRIRDKVTNKRALDKAADESLEQLLKNGKITL